MSERTHSGEIIKQISGLLGRFAKRGELLNANREGIVVHYSKTREGVIAFEFVTPDLLHVERAEFDFNRLVAEGRDYIDTFMEMVVTQLEAAREARMKEDVIELFPVKQPAEQSGASVADAVKSALTEG